MTTLRNIVRRAFKIFTAVFLHLSIATTILGYWIGRQYGRFSWDPEWGTEFKWFFERQREYVYAIEGAVAGAIVGIILASIPQICGLFTRRKKIRFTLKQFLLLGVALALTMLCVRGHSQIRNAPLDLRDPASHTDVFLQWIAPLPGFFKSF